MLIILESTNSYWRGCCKFRTNADGNRVAYMQLPFGSLPINAYIYGRGRSFTFDRIVTPRFVGAVENADNT